MVPLHEDYYVLCTFFNDIRVYLVRMSGMRCALTLYIKLVADEIIMRSSLF